MLNIKLTKVQIEIFPVACTSIFFPSHKESIVIVSKMLRHSTDPKKWIPQTKMLCHSTNPKKWFPQTKMFSLSRCDCLPVCVIHIAGNKMNELNEHYINDIWHVSNLYPKIMFTHFKIFSLFFLPKNR